MRSLGWNVYFEGHQMVAFLMLVRRKFSDALILQPGSLAIVSSWRDFHLTGPRQGFDFNLIAKHSLSDRDERVR